MNIGGGFVYNCTMQVFQIINRKDKYAKDIHKRKACTQILTLLVTTSKVQRPLGYLCEREVCGGFGIESCPYLGLKFEV